MRAVLSILVRILNTESHTHKKERKNNNEKESLRTSIPFELSRLASNFFRCAQGKQIPSLRCVSSAILSCLPFASSSALALLDLHFGYSVNVGS